MKTYNVGILGFGFIGKVHAYGYVNLPFFLRSHSASCQNFARLRKSERNG